MDASLDESNIARFVRVLQRFIAHSQFIVITHNKPCFIMESGYSISMSTVQEIKAAIPKLTLEERAEVARCLHQWENDEWDEQMKRDLSAGKLDKLLKKVDADIAEGNLSDLP